MLLGTTVSQISVNVTHTAGFFPSVSILDAGVDASVAQYMKTK